MTALGLLQSFCRRNISVDDLGYLCIWLMKDYKNITIENYIEIIENRLDEKFFDNNKTIKQIVDYCKKKRLDESNDNELNSLENQSPEY